MRRPLLALAAAWLSASAHAQPLDPSVGHALSSGKPPALAACPGVDWSGSRRSASTLPVHPIVSAVVRLTRGIRQTPASDAAGHLLVAQDDGQLSELDERGRSLWSASGEGEILSAPIITSDGSRVIVAHGGVVRAFDPRGRERCQRALPSLDGQREVLAIPTPSGGVLLGNGARVLALDARCQPEREAKTTDRVVSLLASSRALFAVLEDGTVLRASTVGGFERVARFAGKVTAAALRDEELLAVVDQHALVSIDGTRGGAPRTLASEPGLTLFGAPLLLAGGGSVLATDDDLLSVRAGDGHELVRIPLAAGRAQQRPRTPQLLADARGTLLVAQATREALAVGSDGKLTSIEGAACSDPFSPLPLGNGRAVLACRSGQLFYLAEKAP